MTAIKGSGLDIGPSANDKGAEFIKRHIIETTEKVFDDFAGAKGDVAGNRAMLGLAS